MPLEGFEATISAGKRPQTCALNREVTGTGMSVDLVTQFSELLD